MRKVIFQGFPRRLLNRYYRSMSYGAREIFHSLFAKIFQHGDDRKLSTTWAVHFAKANLTVPIHSDSLWLHWDTAISIVGHDVEIKRFYEQLLNSDMKPSCFFDVGANYGTHSLLFLANDVPTITFEPNPNCYEYFHLMASQNLLTSQLEEVAVGEEPGKAQLSFPENNTWLGSISASHQKDLEGFSNVHQIEVPVITLDQFASENGLTPALIKIDTEGYELNVLKGAQQLLQEAQPLVIFETNLSAERLELFDFFSTKGFLLFDMRNLKAELQKNDFVNAASNNFLAIHQTHPLKKELALFK